MRWLDILLSGLALVVLSPLWILIVIIQKFSGEGDVFYLQTRWGKDLKPFTLFKFSTMLRNSPNIGPGLITVRHDPRVFPFGHFLRMTKLNELPQLVNVLRGEMGIVGPRPMVPSDLDFLPVASQRTAYSVRPGLTGLGSIVFRDEEKILSMARKPLRQCYCEDIAPLKMDIELWYVEHQSLWLDFRIVLLTLWVIVFPHSTLYQRVFGADWGRFERRFQALCGNEMENRFL